MLLHLHPNVPTYDKTIFISYAKIIFGIIIWVNNKQKFRTFVIQKYLTIHLKRIIFPLNLKKTKYLTHPNEEILQVRPTGIANQNICRYKNVEN